MTVSEIGESPLLLKQERDLGSQPMEPRSQQPAIPAVRVHPFDSMENNVNRIQAGFEKFGDVLKLKGSGIRAYCFRHPDDIKQIYAHQTFKSPAVLRRVRRAMGKGVFAHPGGADWKERRRIVSKAIPKSENSAALAPLEACIRDLEQRWCERSNGQDVDLQAELNHLIVDYSFRSFFSTELGDRVDVAGDAFHSLMENFLNPTPMWMPTSANREFKRGVRTLRGLMREIVRRRKSSTDDLQDALSVLLASSSPTMSTDEDVVDQMISIFGGATVLTGSLTWMLYLVATHPGVEHKLTSEIAEVVGERQARLDDLNRLKYASMVFNETLRLYPPAWMTPRVCRTDFRLNQHCIPARSFLFPMIYFLHRHPSFWKSSESFNPDRFGDGCESKVHPAAFCPFGSGSRMCPGAFLAPLIAQYVLIRVNQRFKLRLAPSVSAPIKPAFKFELSPSERVLVRVGTHE